MADDEEIDRGEIAMRFLSQAPPLQFPPVLDGKSDLFVVTKPVLTRMPKPQM